MNNKKLNPSNQSRRSLLKSQVTLGLGALSPGMVLPMANASQNELIDHDKISSELLLAKYLHCFDGVFPEPTPLLPQIREAIQRDDYRIESLTYDVHKSDHVPALLLIPDRVTASFPAPGIAVWLQRNGQYYLGKSKPASLAVNKMHYTAVALVREGYEFLCPDVLCSVGGKILGKY